MDCLLPTYEDLDPPSPPGQLAVTQVTYLMHPFPSASSTWKAIFIPSLMLCLFTSLAIIVKNSWKSMLPFPVEGVGHRYGLWLMWYQCTVVCIDDKYLLKSVFHLPSLFHASSFFFLFVYFLVSLFYHVFFCCFVYMFMGSNASQLSWTSLCHSPIFTYYNNRHLHSQERLK